MDGSEDKGGMVEPRRDCEHVKEWSKGTPLSVEAAQRVLEQGCEACGDTSELWVCLMCRYVGCSRYVNAHMLAHYEETGHPVAISLSDLNTWCYDCVWRTGSYIVSPESESARVPLHVAKHGRLPGRIDTFEEQEQAEMAAVKARVAAAAQEKQYPPPRPLTPNRQHFADEPTDADADPDASAAPVGQGGRGVTHWAHATCGELVEYMDDEPTIRAKVKELAELMRAAERVVVHTGAGISTSAKIPDYRSPTGVWTKRARGEDTSLTELGSLVEARPTVGHTAIKALIHKGLVDHVISTNVDGLHLRSGVDPACLSELHGNVMIERCRACDLDYVRDFDVTHNSEPGHATGRTCDTCGGGLVDTIIAFGESLHPRIISGAVEKANASDMALVLGTSARVSPARDLVKPAIGSLVICNLQTTPFDDYCAVRIFAKTDHVMELLMAELDLDLCDP